MLDINPIKKENNQNTDHVFQNNQLAGQSQVAADNHVNESNEQKPLKSLNANYLKHPSSTQEPEFLETEDVSKLIFYFALVAMFLIFGMTGYLYFANRTQIEELKTKERIQADLEAKIASPELADIDELASRYSLGLEQLSKLINNPIEYSLLFNELQKIVPTDVVLTTVSIDEKNAYKISAKTSELASTAKFVKSLEKSPFFETVFLSGDQLSSDNENKYYTVSVDGLLNSKKMVATQVNDKTQTLKDDSEEIQ